MDSTRNSFLYTFNHKHIFTAIWVLARFKHRYSSPMTVRTASQKDFVELRRLKSSVATTRYFGRNKLKKESEETFFSNYATHRVIVHKFAYTMAYAEIMHYPLIPALPLDCFMHWLHHHFCIPISLSLENTLFLNYLVFSKNHLSTVLKTLLTEIFLRENKIRYIATVEMPLGADMVVLDPNSPQYFVLQEFSKIFYPRVYNVLTCKNPPRLHVIDRKDILPKMRYRYAVPEDNDDLVEIIETFWPKVRQVHGDFFIAELLLREDEFAKLNKIIVTEGGNTTTGFFWLNECVDILSLIDNFELSNYNYLIKFDPTKPYMVLSGEMKQLQKTRYSDLFSDEAINHIMENDLKQSEADVADAVIDDELYLKLHKIQRALDSTSHYLKQYTKPLNVSINIPPDAKDISPQATGIDKNTLETYIQASSNVFTIHLFGIKSSQDKRRLLRILLAAFNIFADRDFCVISFQRNTLLSENLQYLLSFFIPISPRPFSNVMENVYLVHRCCILSDLSVHKLEPEDVPYIQKILNYDLDFQANPTKPNRRSTIFPVSNQKFGEFVKIVLNDYLTNPLSRFTFLTIFCGDSTKPKSSNVIVGFVALRPFLDMANLTIHFLLPEIQLQNRSKGQIIFLKLPALYHNQSQQVFRSIARVSGFWYLVSLQGGKFVTNDLTKGMQPVEPRHIKRIIKDLPQTYVDDEFNNSNILMPIDYLRKKFSLYIHNLKETKYFPVKGSIVIIGFNNIAKAFVRKLIFNWFSLDGRFTNTCCCIPLLKVTVIAEPGIVESIFGGYFPCETCEDKHECWVNFQTSNSYIRDISNRMDLRKYVNFVSGYVRSINRDEQYVENTNGCKYHYNHLLLLCSTKYGPPKQMQFGDVLPVNYAHFNYRIDRIKMYHTLRAIQKEHKNREKPFRFLIFGSTLPTFNVIEFLITHGVSSESITLAVPHKSVEDDVVKFLNTPYVDYQIEEACEDMVEDLGVTVLRRHNFIEWTYKVDTNIIESVSFEKFPSSGIEEVECDFFVSFASCHMQPRIIKVLDDACISLDEDDYIVVDANYRTNDPKILAIGTHIIIQKSTGSPNYQYFFVSYREQAEKLIRTLDIALFHMAPDRRFYKPVYFQANLPLNHIAVKITVPKRCLANVLPNEFSYSLSTYHEGVFCRVRINDADIVEEIAVVGKLRHTSLDFLNFFVGKNESLLNNLHQRYCNGLIPCFLKFFREPWSELITHDFFPELQAKNKEIIVNQVGSVFSMGLTRNETKRKMKSLATEENVAEQLERNLLNFLRKHRNDFQNPFVLPEDYQS